MGLLEPMKRGEKGAVRLNICMRPLCKCGQRPRAINYKKAGKIYYRSLCETCMANGLFHGIPRWQRSGYRMKSQCEKCGFRSPYKDPFRVFHVDGNLDNCRPNNLKTVCANCASILSKEGITWRQGDLIADF
jgi:hypothetical protein